MPCQVASLNEDVFAAVTGGALLSDRFIGVFLLQEVIVYLGFRAAHSVPQTDLSGTADNHHTIHIKTRSLIDLTGALG